MWGALPLATPLGWLPLPTPALEERITDMQKHPMQSLSNALFSCTSTVDSFLSRVLLSFHALPCYWVLGGFCSTISI